MLLRQYRTGFLDNFVYLLADQDTKEAAVVDPAAVPEQLVTDIEENKLALVYVLNTHSHGDHTAGNRELVRRFGGRVVAHEKAIGLAEIAVGHDDELPLGDGTIRVIHTPGHTPDSVCFLAGDSLFTGDTLFVGECGRTDLPGGSSEELWHSFFEKLMTLPDGLTVYPGHDYGPHPTSTLGHEKEHNYTLQPRSLEEFTRFMLEP